MARTCLTCAHPSRAAIDLALLQGKTASSVAREYELNIDGLLRHKAHHLSKSDETSTTLAMLKQVILELDQAALEALSKGDHRAAIDARKRKADTLQSLLQVETQETQAQQKINPSKIPYQVLDEIVAKVQASHERCPFCGGFTPKKAAGQLSGSPIN